VRPPWGLIVLKNGRYDNVPIEAVISMKKNGQRGEVL
jgi:hypothetical protein